jgi:hypothetical protein
VRERARRSDQQDHAGVRFKNEAPQGALHFWLLASNF